MWFQWLTDLSLWVQSFFTVFWKAIFGVCLVGMCGVASGCGGIDATLSDEQNAQAMENKLAWVDKVVEIAERHDIAYRVEINSSGRPSIGESLDLYLDTGLSARVIFFGNGGSDDDPNPETPTIE